MEESLIVVLGPPPDSQAMEKELFDKYQAAKKAGEAHRDGDWETFEKKVVRWLFDHVGESPSIIDELFSKLLNSPIKITGHFSSMGRHQGVWVATITISRSNVLRGKGSSTTWPPPKDVNDAVTSALGYMLKRSWCGTFAVRS